MGILVQVPVPSLADLIRYVLFVFIWRRIEQSAHVLVLLVVRLPLDVDKGLAIHAVKVKQAVQVIHLVLDDSGRPATNLPTDRFSLLVQTCVRAYVLQMHKINCKMCVGISTD